MRCVALLSLLGIAQAAIVMVGDQKFDTAKMAAAINANIQECFTEEEGEAEPKAYDGDCGCALDEGEFCFQLQFTDPDYPEDGPEEDFRCAQLPQSCQDKANEADETGSTPPPAETTPAAAGAGTPAPAGATTPAPGSPMAGGPTNPAGPMAGPMAARLPGDQDDLCCWWASCGECPINPSYMQAMCAGSCAPGAVCTAQPPSPNCKASKDAYLKSKQQPQQPQPQQPMPQQPMPQQPMMQSDPVPQPMPMPQPMPQPQQPMPQQPQQPQQFAKPQGVIGPGSLPGGAMPPPVNPMMPAPQTMQPQQPMQPMQPQFSPPMQPQPRPMARPMPRPMARPMPRPMARPMPRPMPRPQPVFRRPSPVMSRPQTGCTNDAPLCEFWNSIGECQKNARYMMRSCRKACNAC